MKVKRYQGATIKEIVEKIKMDLGPDATILYIKEFTVKRFLRRGRKKLEVIAGIEEKNIALESAKLEMIHYQLKELKESINNIQVAAPQAVPDRDAVLCAPLRKIKARLCEERVREDAAIAILKEFQERFTEKEIKSPGFLEENLARHIGRYIETSGPINGGDNKIVAFIGPTGVGKTTTIAKLAANFSLLERKRVSLITIDTYRIAAVDQLKTYAEIIGIPIEVVFNPRELMASIDRNRDKDLIFIDTAGSNPFDTAKLAEMRAFFEENPDIETHLLVSLTTKTDELMKIFDCYNIMRVHKVIFTKLDEATTYGNILNLSLKIHRPVSYITTGQNVPDDIEVADSQRLAGLVIKGRQTVAAQEREEVREYR